VKFPVQKETRGAWALPRPVSHWLPQHVASMGQEIGNFTKMRFGTREIES